MIRKSIISLLTLIALSANVEAKEALEEDFDKILDEQVLPKENEQEQEFKPQLQEQEFQTINHTKVKQEEDLTDKFNLINPKDQSTNIKKISIKNEFFESLKIVLEPISEIPREGLIKKEFYLNAYENKEDIVVTRGIDYNVKVYNLYNEYLGEIFRPNVKSKSKLAISPFFLIKELNIKREKPILTNQSAKRS
jgi:hypothetical protein